MKFLNDILCELNKGIEHALQSLNLFNNICLYGIAKSVTNSSLEGTKKITAPYIVKDGYYTELVLDQLPNSLIGYHKVSRITIASDVNNKGYGRNRGNQLLTAICALYIHAVTNDIDEDYLSLIIQNCINAEYPAKRIVGIKNIVLASTAITLSQSQVFNEEFKNVEPFVKPEQSYFKVDYTVTLSVDPACFDVCNVAAS